MPLSSSLLWKLGFDSSPSNVLGETSSTIHRCMTKFRIDTGIWRAMVDGVCGSPFSMSNVINLESEGSTTPREASMAFRCVGKFLYLKSGHSHRCLGQVIYYVVAYRSSSRDIVGNPSYGGACGKRG